MAQSLKFSQVVFFLYLNFLSLLSFSTSKSNGFSLELIHIDSPESPLYKGILTNTEKINRLIKISRNRANYLASVLNSNTTFSPKNLRFPIGRDHVYYMVKIQFGNPGIPLYLLPDTGSDLCWTQCEPCTHRFHQNPPIYNSSASRTYTKIPCEDPFCRTNSLFKCKRNECVYEARYATGPVTNGVVSRDVFQSSNNEQIPINFGCSRDNRNFSSFEQTGKIGGIIGLNRSPISLLQQLSNITHQRFSYCLIPYEGRVNASQHSLLRFGNDIPTRGRSFSSTPLISMQGTIHYYLHLQDVSVGEKKLNLPPGTFMPKPNGTGGCIIDTGTPLTMFIPPVHEHIVNEFKTYLDRKGFHRVHLPRLDMLCYATRQRGSWPIGLPSMTFHFQVGVFKVKPQYVFMLANRGDAFCLASKPSPQLNVLGAFNQVNTRFIYDIARARLAFTSEDCLDDRN